jgi:crotonobetainyl-CoA:carnitine CoA-transferase CaiB-like acyl-CoA transferase
VPGPITRPDALLAGLRVVECSMLGPAAVTTALADLGAEVIKVEPPQGDYVRQMTWPIIEGTSLMHLHINRGKRSVVLDLRTDAGREVFCDLVRRAEVVVEAMRPGGLERRGLGFERLRELNPALVMCTVSGYGMTGPYRDLASHGIAYDAWAGIFTPTADEAGRPVMPDHVSIGINAAPLLGALGILAAVLHARATGEGCWLDVAQSDAAAAFDWYRSESHKAYERPETEVTGNPADGYERRAPGIAGMRGGVRYQVYASADGHVLFMASEQHFWRNFCEAVGRADLFERWPGSRYGDHARGNTELADALTAVFRTRTTAEWVQLGLDADVPIAPVHSPSDLQHDPQFTARLGWLPREALGAEQLPLPVRLVGQDGWGVPGRAPAVGEHTTEVLTRVLGYDEARLEALRAAGAFG